MEPAKLGPEFAIRYGGRGNLAWLTKGRLGEVVSHFRPALHPAHMIHQGVQTAASIGQWWEERKQTSIIIAEFEERRLLWCTDLLATLCGEIATGSALPADVTHLLERELRRTMVALSKTSRMELPYPFVLQCQRAARCLVPLNRVMYSELRRSARGDRETPIPEYVPHNQLRALLPYTDARTGVVEALRKALPRLFGAGDDPLSDWMRSSRKDPELAHVEDLALELRSAEDLLEALERLPDTTRAPDPTEEVADLASVPLLAASLGVPRLSSAG
jgi:hypothetical protein